MSSWVNRTVLSGSSVDANGTNSHTCTFTAASSGNLLVAVVSGMVTFTTPTGWSLLVSAVNNTGLYVFTKTSSGGETSFSTTHNGSDFAIKGVVYEFPAGSTILNSSSATNLVDGPLTGPQLSTLSGVYTRFTARTWGMSVGATTASTTWTVPSVSDYDSYVVRASQSGIYLGIAYDDGQTSLSFNPSHTLATNTGSNGEAVSFALNVTNSGPMPQYLQGNTAFDANSGTGLAAAFNSNVTAGNLLVVAAGYNSTSFTASVSDTMGNTYFTAVGPSDNGSIPYRDYIFYAIAKSTGANTVTVTPASGVSFRRVLIHEYTGVNALDVVASNTGSSGTPDSGSATTTHANELIFGWCVSNNGQTTAGSGFTKRQTSQSESTEDKFVTSTGSYHALGVDDGSVWIAQMATFYMSGSTPSTFPWFTMS